MLAIVNVMLWAIAARRLAREAPSLPAALVSSRTWQCTLAGLYVLGCAFRSVIPVIDVPRVALIDSFVASVLVGRSVATVAELAFAAQWALMLHDSSRHTNSPTGRWTARVIFPLIVVAEICSWYSVLTTSNLGHVFEECLWATCAALLCASLIAPWRAWSPAQRRTAVALCAVTAGYVAYMLTIDIPRYLSRWSADEMAGRTYLTLLQGLRDIAYPHQVTYAWDVWRSELDWMFLYFGIGVWTSIALIHAPLSEQSTRLIASARKPRYRSAGTGARGDGNAQRQG